MNSRLLFLFAIPLTLSAIAHESGSKKTRVKVDPRLAARLSGIDSTEKIESLNDFLSLAKTVETGTGTQQVVKLVYDRRNASTPHAHFMNTNQYPFHYDFVTSKLGYRRPLEEFNKNYEGSGKDRLFNLISLSLSPRKRDDGKTEILLELWTGDTLEAKYLEELFEEVKKRLPNEMVVTFHPLSRSQEVMAKKLNKTKTPSVTTAELFAGRDYWALNEGTAYGYVKLVKKGDGSAEKLDLTNIAIFDDVPNDIGLVGGVVTQGYQTPLSHINVKSKNRGTANASLRNAFEVFKPYEGQPIKLTVSGDRYQIEPLPRDKADKLIHDFWESKKPRLNSKLQYVLDPALNGKFVDLSRYYDHLPSKAEHSQLIKRVGGKSANLALIHYLLGRSKNVMNVKTPEALALPFNAYEAFINDKQVGLDAKRPTEAVSLKELTERRLRESGLLDNTKIHPIAKVSPVLKELRDAYQRKTVPESILQMFKKAIVDDKNSPIHLSKKVPRIRLRSSTNSEDIEGFTGAGLYNSVGVNLFKKLEDSEGHDIDEPRKWEKIEQDLKEKLPEVFSSAWNDRAFMEREWFGLDGKQHLDVKVGLAVHHAFPSKNWDGEDAEVANGVAVTTNIYDRNNQLPQFYINGQHFDLAVTNPPTAEELDEHGEDPRKPYVTEENIVTAFNPDPVLDGQPDSFKNWSYERLRNSSLKDGGSVFNDDTSSSNDLKKMELRRLAGALQVLQRGMARVYGKDPNTYPIDVEWKISVDGKGKPREIWIKQAREFALSE